MKRQSEASKKWQDSKGLKIKGFKLKIELIEQFEKACISRGETQSEVISKLMEDYIKGAK